MPDEPTKEPGVLTDDDIKWGNGLHESGMTTSSSVTSILTSFDRQTKVVPLDVFDYEVSLLRHCHAVLTTRRPTDHLDLCVYVEAYLVHYRALLEFFSGGTSRFSTDYRITAPAAWNGAAVATSKIDAIVVRARPLKDRWFNSIGQQLQHMTSHRVDTDYTWKIPEMHDALEEVIGAFEAIRPR
jgi:hypothetical protein